MSSMHRLSAQHHIAQVDSGELFEENNTPLAPEVIESLTNFCSKYRETKNEQAIYFRARYEGIRQMTRLILLFIAFLEVLGVTVCMRKAEYTLSQALLFTHYTMVTTGYGNYPIPKTPAYQVYLIAYIFIGVGAVSILISQIHQYFQLEAKMMKHKLERNQLAHHGPYMISWKQQVQSTTTTDVRSPEYQPPPSLLHSITLCASSIRRVFGDGRFASIAFVFATLLGLLLSGTFVMMGLEGVTFMEGFYFATFTMTTVGYGDISPTIPASTWFVAFWLPFNVAFLSIYWGNILNLCVWVSAWDIKRLERKILKDVETLREEEAKKSKKLKERFSDKKSLVSRGASAIGEVLERDHQSNIIDKQADVYLAHVNHHSNIQTMKDVIAFVRNNLVAFYRRRKDDASYEFASKFLTIESSSKSSMPFHENGARIPSFALLVLVQERFAQIIAKDIAGYQSQVERKECSIGVRISGLSQTMKKWCIPRGARKAFVTVAFESLLFVGEQRLVTDGAYALFALSPFEFHELFSPLLAAYSDAGTMEGWLAQTETLAHTDLRVNDPSPATEGADLAF